VRYLSSQLCCSLRIALIAADFIDRYAATHPPHPHHAATPVPPARDRYHRAAAARSSDGRDQWPSRAAFLLAAMGGCAGQGNLLRYPSVVYNNYGLQWFIPYLLAVTLIAIPTLILKIAIGQAYRQARSSRSTTSTAGSRVSAWAP
jgi:hypothetical protein